jgi:thiol:disulfide interchange protein
MNRCKVYGWVLGLVVAGLVGSGITRAADDAPPVPGSFAPPVPGGFGGGFGSSANADAPVKATARFTTASGGKPAGLFVTATIKSTWHIYSLTQAPGGPIPTTIKVSETPGVRLLGLFQAATPPHKGTQPEAFKDLVIETHEGTATWFVPIEITAGTDPAQLVIRGQVNAQPCTADSCMPPSDHPFEAKLGSVPPALVDALPAATAAASVAPPAPTSSNPTVTPIPSATAGPPLPLASAGPPAPPPSSAPPTPASAAPAPAAESSKTGLPWQPYTSFEAFTNLVAPSFDPPQMSRNVVTKLSDSSLGLQLFYAFIGGIILNFMPCVLPVIGLKILSFVEQSGHNRGRALLLNAWYSLGLMSVFLLLAVLAVGLNLGWGHLFKYAGFNVALTCVVFAMGLSFLGIWELPIPGFAGSGKAQELATQEGFAGAFFKGVITTILATPCTGPFMATALAWAANQPPVNTFAVFGAVGLGMASPYLLIGAFPQLLSFLPKPGMWMETFKQLMGFVLLGTVVYMLTFLERQHVIPTVGLLVAVWFACWWVARTPGTAEASARCRSWVEAAVMIGVAWVGLFPGLSAFLPEAISWGGLAGVMKSRLDRDVDRGVQLYLERQRHDGYELVATGRPKTAPKTVLVDFTAEWCATCKTLEAAILDTAEVRQAIDRNGVALLQADWSHDAPEVTKFMKLLGAQQVPVIAIFPVDRPNDPIVFRGAYTKQQLLDALQRAGASKGS